MDGQIHLGSPKFFSPSLRVIRPVSTFDEDHEWDDLGTPHVQKRWVPRMLRWWAASSLLAAMFLLPFALELAFFIINKHKGWHIDDVQSATTGLIHYLFALPPVAVIMVITNLWAATDFAIKKMQPYVDLAHGNAPAEKTLLLDYTNFNHFFVWLIAFNYKHYLVSFSGLMVLSGLCLQPLAAALFTLRDSYSSQGVRPVAGFRTMGLNPDFADMQAAASAAGFVDASSLYNLSQPNFIQDGWTVSELEIPTEFMLNGTLTANTTAILSSAGCEAPESTSFSPSATNSVLSGIWKGCQASFIIESDPPNQYGSMIATNCSSGSGFSPSLEHKPVVFWAYGGPDATAELVFCSPNISAYNVEIEIDIATNVLSNVIIQSNYVSPNNVTGAPLNGQAFNGLGFDSSAQDRFVVGRSNATMSLLPAAIFQKAARSPGGIPSLFEPGVFIQRANEVYTLFLSLMAKELYYLPSDEPLQAKILAIEKRLWMSPLSTHLLAGILLALAVGGALIHYLHYEARRPVTLLQEPGPIALAASMASQTLPPQMLRSGRGPAAMKAALHEARFRSDPVTGSILVDYSSSQQYQSSQAAKPLLSD